MIRPTKALASQRDLALAYSPGVAEASSDGINAYPCVPRWVVNAHQSSDATRAARRRSAADCRNQAA